MSSLSTHLELTTLHIAAFALVAALCAVAWHFRDGRAIGTRPRPDLFHPPGQRIPLLGDLLLMIKHQPRALDRFVEIHRDYAHELVKDRSRAVSMTVPFRRMVEVSKPEYLEHIQKTNFSNYVKGPTFYKNLSPLLGDGVFCVDGEAWRLQRKATARIFTNDNFKGIITASLEKNLRTLLIIIGRHADRGETFDLADLFFRFTLNSFAEMAFGQDLGALSSEHDDPIPFAVAFDEAQVISNERFINPMWPLLEFFNGKRTRMNTLIKVMDDFAYGVIDEREREGLGNFTRSDKKAAKDKDLLSLYMALRDENGAPLTRKMLRDAILNLIIAGRDTTAQALAWTFFHLLRKPQYIAALRDEVDSLGSVDYDSFKTMTTTTAIFQEGLRLHPSVPKNAWQAVADDVLPNGGPRIEKGDTVFWCDWAMARDTAVWGPDAGEFRPERWLQPDGSLHRESQFKYHVFNAGYRLCLGQNLALYEGTAVLADILRAFDITFAPGYIDRIRMCDTDPSPMYKGALTLSMAEPLQVRATRRKPVSLASIRQ